jgi:hypothetical protein
MGKPVVVSRSGAFAEIPEGCCALVDPDDSEEELLLTYLERLAADPELRRRLGDNARIYAAAHHGLESSARGYADLLHQSAGVAPFAALPPLAPYGEDDVAADLHRAVSAELCDLGVSEADDAALGAVAAALVELTGEVRR